MLLIRRVRRLSRPDCHGGAPGERQKDEERGQPFLPIHLPSQAPEVRSPSATIKGAGQPTVSCNDALERRKNAGSAGPIAAGGALFFPFAEDAHWNAERQAVEFGVEIGEYRGATRVAAAPV